MIGLTINYPGGRPFHRNKINKRKQKKQTKNLTYGNRGERFEDEINESNKYYRARQIAIIHKKPIPIQVVDVHYPKRSAAVIKEAYYRRPSTTDYNGIYKGYYIDFEAKETKNKTSFPFGNLHQHQVEHLKDCWDQGGICFIIIRFSQLDRIFVLDANILYKYWQEQYKEDGKKSISLETLEEEAYEIFYSFAPRVPYIEAIDQLIQKRKDVK